MSQVLVCRTCVVSSEHELLRLLPRRHLGLVAVGGIKTHRLLLLRHWRARHGASEASALRTIQAHVLRLR